MRAVLAGLGAALAGGLVYVQLLGAVGFGTLILAGVLGFAVGRAVRWGAAGQTLAPWPTVAATCAVVGLAGAFVLSTGRLPLSAFLLLAHLVCGYVAVRGLRG